MVAEIISDADFQKLVDKRAHTLLRISFYLTKQKDLCIAMTRPMLGALLSQATQIEELLDACGARNNRTWRRFRSLTATIKLFSNVSYELLHIQHVLPAYCLLPLECNFEEATEQTLVFTGDVLFRTCGCIVSEASALGLNIPQIDVADSRYEERLPPGRLPQDHTSIKVRSAAQTVKLLATAFLNLSAESRQFLPAGPVRMRDFAAGGTNPVSEDTLRSLELRFHNLQSLYDTYVSKTETEGLDTELPVLRGHISIVFHLLKTATEFAHYFERHVADTSGDSQDYPAPLVDSEKLLNILMEYSTGFVRRYLTCAELLCQNMLKRYVEPGDIEVNLPPYRGFHVRPATLVSKIVLHYGITVEMELDDEHYDASSPLELFRANEKINLKKRRALATEIINMKLIPEQASVGEDIQSIIQNIIFRLDDHNKLVIYEHPLKLEEVPLRRDAKLIEIVTDSIAMLQIMGKIDIGTDMRVKFVGDKRVLEDIKQLAQSGYGEDCFGNNIPLPPALAYLKR